MIKLIPLSQITVINFELNLLLSCSLRTRLWASQCCEGTQLATDFYLYKCSRVQIQKVYPSPAKEPEIAALNIMDSTFYVRKKKKSKCKLILERSMLNSKCNLIPRSMLNSTFEGVVGLYENLKFFLLSN